MRDSNKMCVVIRSVQYGRSSAKDVVIYRPQQSNASSRQYAQKVASRITNKESVKRL